MRKINFPKQLGKFFLIISKKTILFDKYIIREGKTKSV